MDFYIDPLARWLGSPNYWYDRNGHSPMWTGPGVDGSWTVLHITDCTEDQATGTFESAAAQRSAHYQIPLRAQLDCSDPDPRKWHPVPGTYDQYVDEGNASWSTGNGDMNENSDDIEHERTQAMLDGHAPFPPGQLLVSMWKVKDLAERRNRPLTREYVIGHGECKAVEATVFGFGRGTTATGCPDDLPVDLILKGAQMLAAGQDPRGLVGALPSVSGTVDDLVYGVSIPGRVYQGGQLFVWSAGVKKGDSCHPQGRRKPAGRRHPELHRLHPRRRQVVRPPGGDVTSSGDLRRRPRHQRLHPRREPLEPG